jgi:paired amphipathic helix protein Sin3a
MYLFLRHCYDTIVPLSDSRTTRVTVTLFVLNKPILAIVPAYRTSIISIPCDIILTSYRLPSHNPSLENNLANPPPPSNQPYTPSSSSPSRPPYSLATLAAVSQGAAPEHRAAPLPALQQAPPILQPYPTNNSNPLPYQQASRNPEGDRDLERIDNREAAIMDDLTRRQLEQRDRELRERQQNGEPPIHQPVALPPSVRTVHGPNGILNNQGPPGLPQMQNPAAFAAMPLHQGGQPHLQPQAAAMMHLPPGVQPGQVNQAQQPILNVTSPPISLL